jgi:hypothetical protein
MAAVTASGGGEVPSWWAERNNAQAARLLNLAEAAKPFQTIGTSALRGVGGDHPKPQGLFVQFLFGPGEFVWPVDSETQLAKDAETQGQQEKFHEQMAEEAGRSADAVFDNSWTAGDGAEAARSAYKHVQALRLDQAAVSRFAKGLLERASSDVERTKRLMTEESDAAHREVETFLRSGSGQSIAAVAAILAPHRTMIQAHSADLHGKVANDTLLFTNKFPLSPADGGPKVKDAGGSGVTKDHSPDNATPSPPDPAAPTPGQGGVALDHSPIGDERIPLLPSGRTHAHSPEGGPGTVPAPPSPLTSLLGSAGELPSMPSMPSMPSGGSGGFPPLSGLQGLFGNFGGFSGSGVPATGGLTSSAMPATPSSLGMDFGRGLAAGVSAAGGAAPVAPVPQPPVAPLTAPIDSAPTSAAPAAAPVSSPAPAPASGVQVPAAPAAGGSTGGLAPYGSVLPPPGAPAAPGAGSMPTAPSIPAEGGGGGPAAPGPGAGVMPVAGRRDGAPVRRDLAETDVELARMAVAELAGAASVTDPGLDWAVAVGRNPSTGRTTLWVATNDGTTYIPPGVFLRKAMPVAAGFDDAFDARWFGWVNPAEKAVRAAVARGESVGAVATTWGWPSEFLEESTVHEVAIGVAPAGRDTPAGELLPSRSHRLQTVDAALYADLKAADEPAVRDYCRELTRRVAFGGAGDELPALAQSVAHALVAGRWPKPEEWAALGAEYDKALLLMGAQRPGINGLEDADQILSYAKVFLNCRWLETLLCWERFGGDLANVVYAAWVAGVRAPLKELALH